MKKYILTLAIIMVGLGTFDVLDAVATTFDVAEVPAISVAPIITTVMNNGHSNNRINIVFLSEAYVASQKDVYFNDMNIAVEELFKRSPFKEYKKFFNVYAVWVASKDSVVSVVPDSEIGDTPWDPLTWKTKTYFGQWKDLGYSIVKIDNVARSFFDESDPVVAVLLENDPIFSGEGTLTPGSSLIGLAVLGSGIWRHDITYSLEQEQEHYASSCAHELGHAFAGLSDEYTGGLAMKPGQTEATFADPEKLINVTTQTNTSLIRWKRWIDLGTPIPTPSSSEYIGVVGLFEGGNVFSSGWYRPELRCTMGRYHPDIESRPPFCKVCREAIVKAIYKYVDPTAEFTSNVGENTTTFTVDFPEPADHSLGIQWKVDGDVIARNIKTFPVTDTEIGYGRHKLSVEISDSTSFVRYDPDRLLIRSKQWDVISLPLPDFTGDGTVDFEDFFRFADHFGQEATTAEVQKYDLDWSGEIDFADFFLFADHFGNSL